MYKFFFFALLALVAYDSFAQSVLPTINKAYYNATYRQNGTFSRTKQPERPPKKLQSPVTLNGYLVVYTEDLGYFSQHPTAAIEQINAQRKFGRDNWRIPTPDELSIMEANAGTLGLGSDIYMCTTHANGRLRLVSTNGSYANIVRIGNTYWTKTNVGTTKENEAGLTLSYQEALANAPQGYRLPTREEALALIYSGEARFGDLTSGKSIHFPFTRYYTSNSGYSIQKGEYWIQGGEIITFTRLDAPQRWDHPESSVEMPSIGTPSSSSQCHVRYVLDK